LTNRSARDAREACRGLEVVSPQVDLSTPRFTDPRAVPPQPSKLRATKRPGVTGTVR
jgi:hypothetical protein